MTEADLRRWLVNHLQRGGVLVQPIESEATGIGIPDIFFRTRSTDGWIELKIAELASNSVRLKWRAGQLNWLKMYASLGGRAFLFVAYDNMCAMFNEPSAMRDFYSLDDFASLAINIGHMKTMRGSDIIRCLNL